MSQTLTPAELRDALDAAFPAAWRDVLATRTPFYRALDAAEQERFEDQVQAFVLTKAFRTTRELAITDEMKLVVAAAACRLTLNLPWQEYTHVGHITLRADESWHSDGTSVVGVGGRWKVSVSWPVLLRDMAHEDGQNVGYHEFAHALDGADGMLDGEAQGPPGRFAAIWHDVIANARAEVARALHAGREPAIDGYAADSDAELFAVATEWFFERAPHLATTMPPLYDLLRDFYRQDPARR